MHSAFFFHLVAFQREECQWDIFFFRKIDEPTTCLLHANHSNAFLENIDPFACCHGCISLSLLDMPFKTFLVSLRLPKNPNSEGLHLDLEVQNPLERNGHNFTTVKCPTLYPVCIQTSPYLQCSECINRNAEVKKSPRI